MPAEYHLGVQTGMEFPRSPSPSTAECTVQGCIARTTTVPLFYQRNELPFAVVETRELSG